MASKQFKVPINLVNLTSDPSGSIEGDIYWNSSDNKLRVYYDGAWYDAAPAGGGTASDSFKTIAVTGQSSVVADSSTDTLNLVAGTNVSITTDSTTDSITINSTGAYTSVDSITYPDYITFDTTPETVPTATGSIYWDSGDGLPKAILNANVELGIGQEQVALVKNATGSTIAKGKVVYINGAAGQRPTIALSDADTEATSSKTLGITAESISNDAEGFVTTFGVLRGVNTNGLTEGAAVWLSSTAGSYTTTVPAEPAHSVFLGYVVKAHATAGEIFVNIQNGYELTELHGVTIDGTPADNEVLAYDSTSGLWINQTASEAGIATRNGWTHDSGIIIQSSSGSAGSLSLKSFSSTIDITDTSINIISGVDAKTWNFQNDGDLVFPDTTVQNTAFLGMSGYTTTNLSEGTNLYFTDERAQDAVGNSVGTGISYNDGTGAISNSGVLDLTGTTNEIVVSASTGSITIGIPDSPVLVTPNIGVATATSVNGTTIPSSKTLVVTTDAGSVFQAYSETLTGINTLGSGTGSLKNTAGTWSYDNSSYQPLDSDLTAVAALTADGILRKTAGTWAMDTATYLTSAVTSIATSGGISGGTITSTGTISLAANYGDTTNPYASKTANYVLASPNGTAGVPTFRALLAADIPTLGNITNAGAIGSTTNLVAVTTTSGVLTTATATNQSATTFLRGDLSWVTPTDTNFYPTAFAWTAGTTAGPTGSLTGAGMSAVSYSAIPSANDTTASGIVTTTTQTFGGTKTFSSNITVPGIATSVTDGTFALVNTGLTGTLNIGGAVTGNINIGSSSSTTVIAGNLTVNGTTTTINTATLSVDDINIELGSVVSPTNTTADGGGITLKGSTDKTFNWVNSTSAWTSSEHISIALGKNLLLNGSTSGTITITPTAISGTNTITIPATTGTMYVSGGTDIALTDGGTNASLTASNGGIVYSTASAMAILAGTATAGKHLQSGVSTAPTWTTSTYADTYAVNTILYAGTANTVTGLSTANSSVLVTSGTGVPSWSTTIPAVTLTTPTIDTINTSLTTSGTASLFNTGITTGTISIGGALTTGTINIGSGTAGAKTINIGTSTGSVTLNGTVNAATLDLTTAATATAATSYFVETGSDGVVRPKTLANVRTEVVTTAAVNSAAATALGTLTDLNIDTVNIDTFSTSAFTNVNGTTIQNVAAESVSYRTAEYIVQCTDATGGKYRSSKIMVLLTSATTAEITEYAILESSANTLPITFTATAASSLVTLKGQFASAPTNTVTVKVMRIGMT